MTQEEQLRFVSQLVNGVGFDLAAMVGRGDIPENWDGHELREFIKDRFAQVVIGGPMPRKRMREYKNTCLVKNLL